MRIGRQLERLDRVGDVGLQVELHVLQVYLICFRLRSVDQVLKACITVQWLPFLFPALTYLDVLEVGFEVKNH